MTHPVDDDHENNPPFSSPCSAPPIEPIRDEPVGDEDQQVSSSEMAGVGSAEKIETVVQLPVANPGTRQQSFEKHAEDSFRMAIGIRPENMGDLCSAASEAYETVSHAFRTSAEELATGMTQLNSKLLEFGRANAQSNLAFVRDFAGVRSVRDLVDLQTAYVSGQFTAMTKQLRELQTLTTDIAGKTTAPFKEQLTRAAQTGRMC